MNARPGVQAKARFVAAVITAIAGSVEAKADPRLGDEAAAQLEATVTEARQRGESNG